MPYGVVVFQKRAKTLSQLSVSTGAFDQTLSIIATDLAVESRVEARNRFRFLNAESLGTIRVMIPHLSGDCEGSDRIRRNNSIHISLGT